MTTKLESNKEQLNIYDIKMKKLCITKCLQQIKNSTFQLTGQSIHYWGTL